MGETKEIRRRLEALNRRPLRERKPAATETERLRREIRKRQARSAPQPLQPIVYRRDIPEPAPRRKRPRPIHGEPVVLEEAVDGLVADSRHGAKAYVISRSILTSEGTPSPLNQQLREVFLREDSALRAWLSDTCDVQDIEPEDAIFFDLETTGLAGTPVFLVGAMSWEEDGLVIRQFLARDYAEEPGILSLFLDWAATKKLLVSFNGKSFDLPYVRVRAAATGIPFSLELPHFDLLHVSRRAWRGTLPDHRLQTLETHVCRRVRSGDIPSHEIPDAYHAYVRSANAVEIVEILKHNMLDLVTLADLMVRLRPPE